MLFMVIERYRNQDARAIYGRARAQGRMLPDGLRYLGSWVEPSFARCFQLMECDDLRPMQRWIAAWTDLVEFEVVPVLTSAETSETVAPLLDAGL
jgi:hypothetical protein